MSTIKIAEVVDNLPKRNVSSELVRLIADTIQDVGLLHPITVTRRSDGRYDLVAGRQRLEAMKRRGETEIEATIVDDFDAAELAAIVENVARQDLTALELAEAFGRWEEFHKRTHRDAVPGSRERMVLVRGGIGGLSPAFATDVAEKADYSGRTLRRLLQIVHSIEPEIRDLLRPTPVADIVTDLEKLARLPADEQRVIAEMLNAGEAMRVGEARDKFRAALPDPNSIATDPQLVAGGATSRSGQAAPSSAAPSPKSVTYDVITPITPVTPAATASRRAVERVGLDPAANAFTVKLADKSQSDYQITAVVDPDNPDLTRAIAAAVPQLAEITVAKRAWYGVGSPTERPANLPDPMPLDQISSLPVVPLTAEWLTPDLVVIKRAGVPVAYVPVERLALTETFHKDGNRKTRGEFPVTKSITQGCFRILTGFERCDQPCYSDGSPESGCFANHNKYAGFRRTQGPYNVIFNGVLNDDVRIRLPKNGGDLGRLLGPRQDGQPHTVRIDAESADGSLSLALGVAQSWAEANPNVYFTTIASMYFSPSDEVLRWAAALPNLWVGGTVSGWFSAAENAARFAAIDRFIEFGIPMVVWVATHPEWDNDGIIKRAKQLVGEDRIIQAPYGDTHTKRLPLLGVNAAGACGDMRYDGNDRRAIVVAGGPGDVPEYKVETEDGTLGKPYGTVHARCRGCSLKCGFSAVFGGMQNAEDADDQQRTAA
jgi:hypothetical protein